MKIAHKGNVSALRKLQYPSTGDQLDAMWKIVDALLVGDEPPADALAVRDAVAAVKTKFKKAD